jgi:hypothetical protein
MHWCRACGHGAVHVGACIPTRARSGKEGPCIQCCCTFTAARTWSTHTRSQPHGSQTGSALESVLELILLALMHVLASTGLVSNAACISISFCT